MTIANNHGCDKPEHVLKIQGVLICGNCGEALNLTQDEALTKID